MDPLVIGELFIKGISALRKRYKNIKKTTEERAALEDFIDTINICISVTKEVGISLSSTEEKSKPFSLVVTLTEVQKTLDEWSREGSRFFLIATDRTEKLKALDKKVDRALEVHNLLRNEQMYRIMKAPPQQVSKQPPSVKDAKGTSTRDSKPSNEGKPRQRRSASVEAKVKDAKGTSTRDPKPSNEGKPRQRRSASVEARKVPREIREVGPKVSNDQRQLRPPSPRHHEPKSKTLEASKVQPKNREGGPKDSNHESSRGSTHHQPKPKPENCTWVEIWAPIDSEKQAKDVEDKLRNSRDIKVEKVRCDQPIKKVMVKVKAVEVKDKSKLNQTLLREARDALARDKPLPTLWKNRPR